MVFLALMMAFAVPAACQTNGELEDYFKRSIGFGEKEIVGIRGGQAVARVMKSRTPREIFVIGAVYIKATPEAYIRFASTTEYSALVAITIPPGKEAGEETHDNNDQALFIVEGRGEAILNGHAEPAGEHDAVFIPAGTAHNINNSGVENLKMFVVYSPPLDADAAAAARTWRGSSLPGHRAGRSKIRSFT